MRPEKGPDMIDSATTVRCGNHPGQKVYHDSIASVRECFKATAFDSNAAAADWDAWKQESAYPEIPAAPRRASLNDPSASSVEYLRNLLADRIVEPRYRTSLEAYLASGTMTAHGVSTAIDRLKPMEKKDSGVMAGRYAVEHEGTLKFYAVDKPEDGRWKGHTFLSVQASDDFHRIRSRESVREILALIAVDPKEAMLRYGREIGSCGKCHKILTNEESRTYGVGPVCRAKLGW